MWLILNHVDICVIDMFSLHSTESIEYEYLLVYDAVRF